jgi:hypothetical protein
VDSGIRRLTAVVASSIVIAGAMARRAFGGSSTGEIDMTTLQDVSVRSASLRSLEVEPASLLPLPPSEPRAQIAILSTAKRNALLACFNAGGLHKKDGAWHGAPGGKPVSGVTVADLTRDGMLTLTTGHGLACARLTERGSWFARTLLREATAAK